MGKSAVILYITIGLLLLLILSHNPKKPSNSRRRLKVRSSFNLPDSSPLHHHEQVAFDPLLADIESRLADKQWTGQYFKQALPKDEGYDQSSTAPGHEAQAKQEDFVYSEDYVNDEEKFNVTSRLVSLFPRIDVDPADGYVSKNELTDWNLIQTEMHVMHRAESEMNFLDRNKDGFLSFAEYEPPRWAHHSDASNDMGWWKEKHFNASDADGDGLLNIMEFKDFLYPADSKKRRLLQWLCEEEIRERDSDEDGKISFQEFFHGIFDLLRNYDEGQEFFHGLFDLERNYDEGEGSSHHSDDTLGEEALAELLFALLDKGHDGYLSEVELRPIIRRIHRPESYYAKQQAKYIISQADKDKDGRLSLAEMIENPYVFYSAIFEDDGYDFHDEFR